MRRIAAFAVWAALWAASMAGAACPPAEALASRYGITTTGFEAALPRTANRAVTLPDLALIRVPVGVPAKPVPDGFTHTALIDLAGRRA